jgi:hypothetical protein
MAVPDCTSEPDPGAIRSDRARARKAQKIGLWIGEAYPPDDNRLAR